MMAGDTYHGSRERVSWAVVRNGQSYMLHGEDEQGARADYAKRSKTLHQGETLSLERTVRAESWVQHTDTVESREKAVSHV